jgi:hypothetical protein
LDQELVFYGKIRFHIPNNHLSRDLIMTNESDFLYPHASYQGEVKPENLVFDANLQEFAQRISLICALETGGKISPGEAYHQIKALWEELKQSKKMLGIEDSTP